MILSDSIKAKVLRESLEVVISGGMVFDAVFEGEPRLLFSNGQAEYPLRFARKASPRIALRYPQGLNAGRARIEPVKLSVWQLPLQLFVEDTGTGVRHFIRSLDVAEFAEARALAIVQYCTEGGHIPRTWKQRSALLRAVDHFLTLSGLQAKALVRGYFGRKPAEFRRAMNASAKKAQALGRPSAIEAVREGVALAGMDEMTPHGEREFLAHYDSNVLWDSYQALAKRLADLGLEVFLNSGTLLGVTRDGDFLPHDDDIDVAVMLKAKDSVAAAREFYDLQVFLAAEGLIAEANADVFDIIKLNRVEGVQVDLFPAWIDDEDKLYIYPHSCGNVTRDDLYPLKLFKDREAVFCPANAEALLESNYGPGWRVPDPYFVFSWPAARAKFRTYVRECRELQNA